MVKLVGTSKRHEELTDAFERELNTIINHEVASKNVVKTNVSGSLNQMRAINTFKEMGKQLKILKQDVSSPEYVGFEMCMKIFCERYEKWTVVNSNNL